MYKRIKHNSNSYNFEMKLKTLFLVFFICFSSYAAAAKYGKTDPNKLYTKAVKFIDQERYFEAKKC